MERQAGGEPLTLILDQTKISERHQVLMLAARSGERALPLAWRVETTEGAIGFETQKALLDRVAPWASPSASVTLLGNRFYGTADLIGWCQEQGWNYRLRLKGNLVVFDGDTKTTTKACAAERVFYLEDVELTGKQARTNIDIIHDPGHAEPWNTAAQIYRLYNAVLDRNSNLGGLKGWDNALHSGTSLQTVINDFTGSAELQAKYGSVNNTQFETLLYNNVLDRAPDGGRLAH